MPAEPRLQTERLLLRRWLPADLAPCAAINVDPLVMEHFPGPLSSAQTASFIERQEAGFDERGFAMWAVELPGEAAFVGFVGLLPIAFDASFTPAVEVGWRLAFPFWGRGIATEAAAAAIAFGFDELGLSALVAYTTERNLRSRRVMARLGMLRDPGEDFSLPGLAPDDPLTPHVLYRTDPGLWRETASE